MQPGIQRDGTQFSSNCWTEGQWTRFQRGVPKKMLGYQQLAGYNPLNLTMPIEVPNIPRGVSIVPNTPNFNMYWGDRSNLRYVIVNRSYSRVSQKVYDRTPVDFAVSDNNTWSFDIMFNNLDDDSVFFAYAGQNLKEIDSEEKTPIYYGKLLPTTDLEKKLIPLEVVTVAATEDNPIAELQTIVTSGGFVVIHPYLFIFGNAGSVIWSSANDPTNFYSDDSSGVIPERVCSKKIVAGRQTRGGQNSPAGVLWSLDSVIRVTFSGTPSSPFTFDTVTDQASILSSNAIVEIDGLFYWPAVDRFLVYNGTVKEVPNDKSLNFFFQNLNYEEKEKIWATKVTEFGEVWWYFPTGTNTECNHAVVLNYRENTWYDTDVFRSSGDFAQVFTSPVWADNTTGNLGGSYSLWAHEVGVNKVFLEGSGRPTEAIPFYIISGSITYCANGPSQNGWVGMDRWVLMVRFEPDAIQQTPYGLADSYLTILGKEYAQSEDTVFGPYPMNPTTLKIDLMVQAREMRLMFGSANIDAYWEMGQPLLHLKLGDARQ